MARSRTPGTGLRPLTWKPAELGVGDSGKAIPVYISDHSIARLHERIPIAPHFDVLHKNSLRRLLEFPLSPPEFPGGRIPRGGRRAGADEGRLLRRRDDRPH